MRRGREVEGGGGNAADVYKRGAGVLLQRGLAHGRADCVGRSSVPVDKPPVRSLVNVHTTPV